MQVEDWLRQNGLDRYAAQLEEHDVDLDILGSLTDADLREIGLPIGARKRLLKAVSRDQAVKQEAANNEAPGERRQVTVVFCDLVDFTGLSTSLDPEDLEVLIARVVDVCRREVARWGGYVGNYMGDGILVYFGWPKAYEDAPERAAHASLQLVRAVSKLKAPDGQPLAMRAGMATGLVLIGRRMDAGSGQLETVFGRTPNLASRLESMAAPGQVLLDEATSALLPDGRFSRSNLGTHKVKGFKNKVGVWRLDETQTTARPQTVRNLRLGEAPLQGRDGPLIQLERWWNEVRGGEGTRLVHLSGDAGIGKSHLAAHFLRRCRETGGQAFELQCWPYNDNATLYPMIAYLNARAGVQPTEPTNVRRDAFVALAKENGLSPETFVEGMGDLLDLGLSPEGQTAEMRHVAWFAALLEDLQMMSRQMPVMLLLEDMHWTDPVTLQFLNHLARACESCRIMIVITTRPHFEPGWESEGARELALSRVGRAAAERIVDQMSGEQELDTATRARIINASDGVPLFINELTREVLERSAHTSSSEIQIPPTLQGVLSSRLDSAGDAKDIAQVASCLGRVFDPEVLSKVVALTNGQLGAQLDRLSDLALIEPVDEGSPEFIFRHALIQEAAYQSQPKVRRRDIHGKIADIYIASNVGDARQVANHLTAAERFDDAIVWWKNAGDRAAGRSAQREAMDIYQRGLRLFDRLPQDTAHWEMRLSLLLALGPVLSAIEGYGAEAVGALYAEAADLADAVGTHADRFAVRRGLWLFRQMSAQYDAAGIVADQMVTLSKGEGLDAALALEANRARGATAFMLGELETARRHLEAVLSHYSAGVGAKSTAVYGDDPGLASMAYLSSTLWYLGYPEDAADCCEEMLEAARKLDHPFSMARSLTFSAFTYHLMQDFDRLLPIAEEAARYSDKFEFPFHAGVGRILWGWALCKTGDRATGAPIIEEGYAQYSRSGSHMLQPLYLSLMAELAIGQGDLGRAAEFSDRAMINIEASREALVLPEVLRVHGDLQVLRGESEGALALFDRAIGLARAQGSRFCEMRALVSATGINPARRDDLGQLLKTFATASATRDLEVARAILEG